MQFTSLYRRYRPQTFDEVIGQDSIVRILRNQIKSSDIAHAYIFTGTRGVGKTSTAKIFARAINCLSPVNGSSCGKCEACLEMAEANNLNIVEMDAASNSGVDNIRSLRDEIRYVPTGKARFKVFIIDEVHALTLNAFNAFLKTLEEPPEHIVFILATTDIHKVPQTILSRCLRFDFKLVTKETLMKHLSNVFDKEGVKYTQDGIAAIAEAGEGSVRDALSIADTLVSYAMNETIDYNMVMEVLGANSISAVLDLLEAMLSGDIDSALTKLDGLCSNGKNVALLAGDLEEYLNYVYVVKKVKNANECLLLPSDIFARLQKIAQLIDESKLLKIIDVFLQQEGQLRYAAKPNIVLSCGVSKAVEIVNAKVQGASQAQATVVNNATLSEKDIADMEKRILDKLTSAMPAPVAVEKQPIAEKVVVDEEPSAEFTRAQYSQQQVFKEKLVQFIRIEGEVVLCNAISGASVYFKRKSESVFELYVSDDLSYETIRGMQAKLVALLSKYVGLSVTLSIKKVVKQEADAKKSDDVIISLFGVTKVKIS